MAKELLNWIMVLEQGYIECTLIHLCGTLNLINSPLDTHVVTLSKHTVLFY